MTLDDNKDDCSSDLVECAVFTQKDLAFVAMPVMEDIRRDGKLCDVTIKVRVKAHLFLMNNSILIIARILNDCTSRLMGRSLVSFIWLEVSADLLSRSLLLIWIVSSAS